MRILITGITGMVGSHLAEYVLAHHPEVEVHGMVRWRSPRDNIRAIQDRVRLHEGELRDLNSLVRVLDTVKPEDLGVDVTPRLKTLKVSEPAKRGAGVKVADVAALVEKLKNEAKVI